jgi:hypothetical protein
MKNISKASLAKAAQALKSSKADGKASESNSEKKDKKVR